MKKHRNNLMKRGLAAVLSGMMLLATVMPAMAEEINLTPVVTEGATMNANAEPAPEAAGDSSTNTSVAPEVVSEEAPVAQESASIGNTEAPEAPQENAPETPETDADNSEQPEAVTDESTDSSTDSTDSNTDSADSNTDGSEGSTDGSAPVPAGAEGTAPQSTIELLPVDETAPEGTSHTLIEINEETTTKELSTEPMTLEAHTYNGINVKVEADAGVLPVDTHLSVFEVKSETHRTETAEKLDEAEVDYDDYMVLDISLYDSEFNKIEPESGVRVSITMDAEKLPEEAVAETLGVQHLEEDENGEVKDVVQVADNGLETEGFVEVTDNNEVAADFEVGSFSKFVITWKSAGKLRIVFTAYDEKGNAIPDFRWPNSATGGEYTVDLIEDLCGGDAAYLKDEEGNPRDFLLEDILREYGMYEWQQFVFKSADIGAVKNAKGFRYNEETKRVQPFSSAQTGTGWLDDGGNNPDMPVSLYYTTTKLHVVPTVDSTSMGIEMYISKHDAAGTAIEGGDVETEPGRKQYKAAGRTGGKLYYKDDVYGINRFVGPRQYDPSMDGMALFEKYKNQEINTTNWKNGAIWGNPGGEYPWKMKFGRAMIWPSLVTRLIEEGEEFPRMDISNRGSYLDYVADFTGEKEFAVKLDETNSLSLKEWFDPAGQGEQQVKGSSQQVNHLFREDIYEETGYFYYGSDRNHAQLEDQSAAQTNFKVYNETATRITDSYPKDTETYQNTFFIRRGNFLPYNHIVDQVWLTSTETDMAGNDLADLEAAEPGSTLLMGEYLKDEAVYKVQERGVYSFGLSMKADFVQPENGRVQWKDRPEQPMIFEFNGDDDVWIYIDDVLVLDLGGSHAAQNAIINFETGNIYWTDNGSAGIGNVGGSPKVVSNVSVFNTKDDPATAGDYVTVEGDVKGFAYDDKSTLREMFERAIGEAGTEALNIWSDGNNGNTFRSGTRHTFKFYYIEHGGGASNLRLSFNIQPEPIGDLEVAKEFTEEGLTYEKKNGENSEAVIPDDFRAVFTLYTARENAQGKWEPDEFVDEVELTQETYDAGLFEKREVNGKTQFVHTFNRLALSQLYIVDEKIYKSGKGYLGADNNGTEIHHDGVKDGVTYPANQAGTNAKRLMSTATASGVESVGGAKDKIYGFTWSALGNTQYHLRAYTHDEEGNVVRIDDAEEVLQDIMFWAVDIIRDRLAGQDYVQNGNKIFFEDVLKDMKLQKAGSYILNHMEWGSEGMKVAGIEFQTDGPRGFYMLDEAGNRVTGLIRDENRNGHEIRVFYDKAFYEYRSEAFEIYGVGNKSNYPATLVVENKYLTPLSVRKVLRSRMETDPDRDFSFRIYIKNRDGSVYNPDGGLVGSVYEVKKVKDPETEEEKEEITEKMVTDEHGAQVPDKRYLLLMENEYFEFTLKRDEEITFGLPKGLTYRVVELVEQGYKVTGMINLKDSGGSNKEIDMNDEPYTTEKQVRMKKWTSDEHIFTEETLVTITNTFDIARTGLSMSTVPFILMVVFALLAIGGLAFITIRRRAMNIDD